VWQQWFSPGKLGMLGFLTGAQTFTPGHFKNIVRRGVG
jgi:hypothetical protein